MKCNLTEAQIIDLLNGITIKVFDPKTDKTYSLALEKCIQSHAFKHPNEKLHSKPGQAISRFKLDTGETVYVLNN